MRQVLVFGASGHAKAVIDTLERQGIYRVAGIVDANLPVATTFCGYPILGRDVDLPELVATHGISGGVVAIGDNWRRQKVATSIRELCPDLTLVNSIHPSAVLAPSVTVGEGTTIMAGVVINADCHVGRLCILNTNASLDHDSEMGDAASLGPGAIIGGCVTIGASSAVCIGATVVHNIRIGPRTVVGAGAVVVRDVGANVVAFGNPARAVRVRNDDDPYL
jgi:sugar O-acyltransferase (sialic acid O-acetyltransferase NeuD family)